MHAPPLIRTLTCALALSAFASNGYASGERLYGVHWWDYANATVGSGAQGGWSVETIITNSDPWWRAPYFAPLYQQVSTTHNAEIITRVDYNWGETVPTPASSSATDWANRIVSEVIGPLGPYAHRWVIGNEPNLTGEATNWPAQRITPAAYAEIYHTVRQIIKRQRPQDEVLFAPVSPGGVVANIRWQDGNSWLADAIDATLALSAAEGPGGAIDGFALHAYGNPNAGAAQAVAEFHNGYTSQLAVIDSRSLQHTPVYITEWNRATQTSGDLANNERVSAEFLTQSLLDVDRWNRTPGNHNIRTMAWFVHYGYGGWEQYSLKWWQNQGNPVGNQNDLWTALLNGSNLQAGLVGTRPAADYNTDGDVTAVDYDAWRAAFNNSRGLFADGNRNGIVDAADYVLWRRAHAADAGAAGVTIPEPTTAVLFAAVGMGWLIRRTKNISTHPNVALLSEMPSR